MTQIDRERAEMHFKAVLWRSALFGFLCAMVYITATYLTIPNTALAPLLEGGVLLGLFGLVCWLWPPVSAAYLLLLALLLFGSAFWITPMGWLGALVMGLPGLAPFFLFALPAFVRFVGKPAE